MKIITTLYGYRVLLGDICRINKWVEKTPLPWWSPSYCYDTTEETIVDLIYEGSWNNE